MNTATARAPQQIPQLLTLGEAGKILKIDPETLSRLIEKKQLQAYDFGTGSRRLYRVRHEDILLLLDRRRVN